MNEKYLMVLIIITMLIDSGLCIYTLTQLDQVQDRCQEKCTNQMIELNCIDNITTMQDVELDYNFLNEVKINGN